MYKYRRYERHCFIAELVIRSEDRSACYSARMFNVSQKGACLFSRYYFRVGELVTLEMILPIKGVGMRRVILNGVVRHVAVHECGNIFGIEFHNNQENSGDLRVFNKYIADNCIPRNEVIDSEAADLVDIPSNLDNNKAFTLMETCIALIIISLMVVIAAPIYHRAMEHARVSTAAANLKTIWSAQRVYWLEYRTFSQDMDTLQSMDLLNPEIVNSATDPDAPFVYQITQADEDSFTAVAIRNASGVWSGQISIDQTGQIEGQITGPEGYVIQPPQ